MIAIVDYGMGNLGSIANMLRKIGVEATISSDPETIGRASKLILPGVGAFDEGMRNLEERGFLPLLNRRVIEDEVPVLGICLGMQLLSRSSEEGSRPGLGWIDGRTIRFGFPDDRRLKIPHMGWNTVVPKPANPLIDEEEESRFYFVHSYYVMCEDESDVLATTSYGIPFTSAVQRGNIFGTQFHPEKSHRYGMALLRNFASQ